MTVVNVGKMDAVKLLVQYGADVNDVTLRSGKTPLHLAAEGGYLQVLGTDEGIS
jgi:ankyrin repeat protein